MILPEKATGPSGRYALYRNLIRQCEVSVPERRSRNLRLKQWYLTGTETGQPSRYNKLFEFVDTATAYIFAAEAVRFSIVNQPKYGDAFMDEEDWWRDELHRLFHDSGVGAELASACEWAHVYDSMLTKVFVNDGEVAVQNIQDPSNFGVLQEDLPSLDRQEAVCEWYYTSVDTFGRYLRAIKAPDYLALMAEAEQCAEVMPGSHSESLPSATTASSLLVFASAPTMQGAARGLPMTSLGIARVTEKVLRMAELWAKDDALGGEYRVVTCMLSSSGEHILAEPQNPLTPMELPYVQLSLLPLLNYVWGLSTLEGLTMLQAWREKRLDQIDGLMVRQLDPPFSFEGVTGITDEKAKLLRKPGGNLITAATPGSKITNQAPPMPPDAFAEIKELDEMFARRGGIPAILNAQGEPGLRAGNQTRGLATLGSARLRRRAMRVEAFTENVATRMIRLQRRISGSTMTKIDGTKVLASQIPESFVALVDAHSASPLYAEQIADRAEAAVKNKAIDKDDYVDLLGLPRVEMLRAKARRRMKSEAELTRKALAIKQEDADTKRLKAEAQAKQA